MEIVIRWFLLVCIRYWIPSNTNAHSLKWKSNWVFKTNLSCTQDCFLCRSQSSFHSTLIKLLLIKHWSGPICFFYYGRYQLTKLNHRLIEWMVSSFVNCILAFLLKRRNFLPWFVWKGHDGQNGRLISFRWIIAS